MIDIEKQVNYWLTSAEEDWAAGGHLFEKEHVRHSLFFAHLTLEKSLKAHICRATGKLAPKLHNLLRLAELSGVSIDENRMGFLAEMNQYNLEGRYPGTSTTVPSMRDAEKIIQNTGEMFLWLKNQL